MRIDFVNYVSRKINTQRQELVEKDIILHQILKDLSESKFFAENFLFKGGTCLIKSYLGYKRFSEDIDFTWKDQDVFQGKSRREIGKHLSNLIDKTGEIFKNIVVKRELDFNYDKSNSNYIEIGGGGKTCTYKIWYESAVLLDNSFVKVQINFVEKMCFPPKKGKLRGLSTENDREIMLLFPEYEEYFKTIDFFIYDINEILSEKVRAILTRRGTKARDFLDIYFIAKELGIRLEDVNDCILAKTNFALRIYEKYGTNFKEKIKLLESDKLFEWGTERDLLLSKIDDTEFYTFLSDFQTFLKTITKKSILNLT